MRGHQATLIHQALVGRTDAASVATRERTAALVADCGCGAGAAAMTAALLVVTVSAVARAAYGPVALLVDVGLVLVAAAAGKAAGIGLAGARLRLLARRVTSQACESTREGAPAGGRHVHVH